MMILSLLPPARSCLCLTVIIALSLAWFQITQFKRASGTGSSDNAPAAFGVVIPLDKLVYAEEKAVKSAAICDVVRVALTIRSHRDQFQFLW